MKDDIDDNSVDGEHNNTPVLDPVKKDNRNNMLEQDNRITQDNTVNTVTQDRTHWPCPYCGNTETQSGKPFGSLNSVKGHMRISHPKLYTADGGNDMKQADYEGLLAEGPSVTPPQVKQKGKKTKRVAKREYVEVDSVETELSPAEKNHLAKLKRNRILAEEETAVALARVNRDQAVDRLDGRDPWNYDKGRFGSRRRPDEYQPKEIDPVDEEIQKTLKQLRQVSIINKLKRGEEDDDDDDGEEESTADRLLEQLEEKDKALLDERQRSHEKEMTSQRQMFELQMKNVDERIARMEKDRNQSWEQLAAQTISKGINKIGDTSSKLLAILMEEDARPPVRERGGPSNIADMVAEIDPSLVYDSDVLIDREPTYQEPTYQNAEAPVERRRFSGSVINDRDVGTQVEPTKEVKEE